MERHHYVVYYTVMEGTEHRQQRAKAATIMGVAEVIADLHKAGTPARRWEKVQQGSPSKEEREALEAFLGLAGIPVPRI